MKAARCNIWRHRSLTGITRPTLLLEEILLKLGALLLAVDAGVCLLLFETSQFLGRSLLKPTEQLRLFWHVHCLNKNESKCM